MYPNIVVKSINSLFIPKIHDGNNVVMADNEGSVICDRIDLVFSVWARAEGEHSAPKF